MKREAVMLKHIGRALISWPHLVPILLRRSLPNANGIVYDDHDET